MRLVQNGRNDPMSQRPVFRPTVANTMHAPTIAHNVHDLMPDGRRLCTGFTEGSEDKQTASGLQGADTDF